MTSSSLWGPLAAFALILALIPVALWLLKRTPIGGAGAAGLMRVVAALPLSASQRIVTVEVGSGEERRWLVLGVTPAGIQTLHTLPPQVDAPAAGAAPASLFAQLLQRQRGAGGASGPGSTDAR